MIYNSKIQLARKLSYKARHRVRIGAVVAKGKSVVGVGFNKMDKTHPLITRRNPLKKLHAEVDAIIGIDRNQLIGSTIYVYRELLNGKLGMCKPCIDCQFILREAGVKKAYYSDPSIEGGIGVMEL